MPAFDVTEKKKFDKALLNEVIITAASVFILIPSVLFLVTGFLILGRLKKYYTTFYKERRCQICLATFFLSAPLFVSVLYDNLGVLVGEDKFTEFKSDHSYLDLLIMILSDDLPIIFQLSTMMFGMMKQK